MGSSRATPIAYGPHVSRKHLFDHQPLLLFGAETTIKIVPQPFLVAFFLIVFFRFASDEEKQSKQIWIEQVLYLVGCAALTKLHLALTMITKSGRDAKCSTTIWCGKMRLRLSQAAACDGLVYSVNYNGQNSGTQGYALPLFEDYSDKTSIE